MVNACQTDAGASSLTISNGRWHATSGLLYLRAIAIYGNSIPCKPQILGRSTLPFVAVFWRLPNPAIPIAYIIANDFPFYILLVCSIISQRIQLPLKTMDRFRFFDPKTLDRKKTRRPPNNGPRAEKAVDRGEYHYMKALMISPSSKASPSSTRMTAGNNNPQDRDFLSEHSDSNSFQSRFDQTRDASQTGSPIVLDDDVRPRVVAGPCVCPKQIVENLEKQRAALSGGFEPIGDSKGTSRFLPVPFIF